MEMLLVLLLSSPLNSVLSHPPRDLAALLDPPAVLQKMNVQTTDEALIALLRQKAEVPPKEAADAPKIAGAGDEGDMLYVKKLMVIRFIERNKSAKGLSALQEVANGPDITLREAAQEAIAAINGKPSLRPSGAALLKELFQRLPPDTGFVLALDFERDSKSVTLHAFLESALKEMEAKGAPKDQPANADAPPAPAASMQEQMKRAVTEMIPQADQGILAALAMAGNLRLDAAMLFAPSDFGTQPGANHLYCVVKGLYDPARVGALLDGVGNFQKREIAGHAVYAQRNGAIEICLFDPNTFLFALGFGKVVEMNPHAESGSMENMIGLLTAAKTPPKLALTMWLDFLMDVEPRLLINGEFSTTQKESITASLMKELEPARLQHGWQSEEVVINGTKMLLSFVKAQLWVAVLYAHQGHIVISIACSDPVAATALNDSMNKFHKTLLDIAAKPAVPVQPPLAMLLGDVTKSGGYLWMTEVADNMVTMKLNNLLRVFLICQLALEAPSRRQQPAAVQPAPPPAAPLPVAPGTPPPEPQAEVIPDPPGPSFVWTPGSWNWQENSGWFWKAGQWVQRPQPGAIWAPGVWSRQADGWHLTPGHWLIPTSPPAAPVAPAEPK